MAVSSDSYGTVDAVEALSPQFVDASGDFTASTTPTLAQVESWIDGLSARINVIVDRYGSVPATGTLATALADIVVEAVADRVKEVRGAKRRGPNTDGAANQNPFARAMDEAEALVDAANLGDIYSVAVTRADAYSDDKDTVTAS